MPWFYYVVVAMLKVLCKLLTRREVKGKENIPSQGPVLIVANHLNLVDPPLLGISGSRKMIFMAKAELFRNKFIGYFMRGFGSFPVHRERLDKRALRQAGQVLAEGRVLAMFPEGARSRHAQLGPAFSGSVLIALRNSAPILPVGITGTEKIKGVAWLLHRPQITVNIGQPFHLPSAGSKLTKEELAGLTSYVMERIAELLPKEYQGAYAKKEVMRHAN